MESEQATLGGWDLHLDIGGPGRRRSSLEEAIRGAVRSGRLTSGTRLPSTRALAADLGLARGTVTDAYDQLAAEGWLVARQGSGTRVAAVPVSTEVPRGLRRAAVDSPPPRHDFRPGRGDLSNFPRGQWVAALRRGLRDAPDTVLEYGDPRGLGLLRDALATYIGRARGLAVDPDLVVVCNGWVQGFSLIAEVLRNAGATRVAVENPSMARNPATLRRFGLGVVSVPVDRSGANPAALVHRGPVGAVLLTPAHQYPTGATLSADRRAEWIGWARRHDTVLIEDDYDGEFRYDRQPVGALAGLDSERVIYAGTTSKTLAPGLRLGWLVLPSRWLEPVAELRPLVDRQTSALDQLALAEMLRSGAFDRHVRHSRIRYRKRSDLLLSLLAERVPAVTAHGIAAGLHMVIELPVHGPTEQQVVDHLTSAGVAVQGLADYHHGSSAPSPPALVVGFATPAEHAYAGGVHALAGALADLYP